MSKKLEELLERIHARQERLNALQAQENEYDEDIWDDDCAEGISTDEKIDIDEYEADQTDRRFDNKRFDNENEYFKIGPAYFSIETGLLEYFSDPDIETYDLPQDERVTGVNHVQWGLELKLKKFSMGENAIYIGNEAFRYLPLEEMQIGESVEYLGDGAFKDCDKLRKVEFLCTDIVVPRHCFKWCSSLETVILPDRVLSIDSGAFCECTALRKVYRAEDAGLGYDVVIPANIDFLGWELFRGCEQIHSMKMPNCPYVIQQHAFQGMKNLESINLANAVSIGAYAFCECSSLKDVYLSQSTKKVGKQAFAGCGTVRLDCSPEFECAGDAFTDISQVVIVEPNVSAMIPSLSKCKVLFYSLLNAVATCTELDVCTMEHIKATIRHNKKSVFTYAAQNESVLVFVLREQIPNCEETYLIEEQICETATEMIEKVIDYRRSFSVKQQEKALNSYNQKKIEQEAKEEKIRQHKQRKIEAKEKMEQSANISIECDVSIEEMDLSVRAYNCLKRAGVNSLSDLIGKSEEDLMKIRNLGRTSTEEIKQRLLEYGYTVPYSWDD